MPINREKYNTPAIRGDLAGAVIAIAGGLDSVASALRAISAGGKPTESDINDVQNAAERLGKLFDDLTGYANAN